MNQEDDWGNPYREVIVNYDLELNPILSLRHQRSSLTSVCAPSCRMEVVLKVPSCGLDGGTAFRHHCVRTVNVPGDFAQCEEKGHQQLKNCIAGAE